MTIAAIIVTYNIGKGFLENFNATRPQVDKVFIIDNNSSAETTDLLKRIESRQVEVTYLKENYGLAAAQNIALNKALKQQFDWILLLDHDSKPRPNMVKFMLEAHSRNYLRDKIGILSPFIIYKNYLKKYSNIFGGGKFWISRQKPEKIQGYYNDLLFVISSGSLIKARVFKEVGLMDERLFIDFIDVDFCLRARLKGHQIMLSTKAELEHQLGEQTEHIWLGKKFVTSNYPASRRYFTARNRMIMIRRYILKFPALCFYLCLIFLYEIFLVTRFEHDKKTKLKAALRGLRDSFNFLRG